MSLEDVARGTLVLERWEGVQMRWWPRSIRWQMFLGLVLLESLSIGLFAFLLTRQQTNEIYRHAKQRLVHQADSVAIQAREAMEQDKPGWIELTVRIMGQSPTVETAKVTDTAGKVLYVGSGQASETVLDEVELAQISQVRHEEPRAFRISGNRWEGVKAIYVNHQLKGYAWVETDQKWDQLQIRLIWRGTLIFGLIWIASSAVLVVLLTRSIARPLEILHRGTRALMESPESTANFPLPVVAHNELGNLIEAFNRMYASIEEQRHGLNDTLSLLDSMLANAPIGLAFFDRRCRIVRVNQVFANMTGVPLSRHLGRTLPEVLPQPVAEQLENTVLTVIAEERPVRDVELNSHGGNPDRAWTWLASAYPVRPTPNLVRWVGVIVLDASERKRSEEALRKTEKLAATGRLAASVAHEINNPLEAITNLLYLLRNFCQLEDPALNYVVMAEHEARRIAEITQQTLRFYRQSTLPARANMAELLDSVLSLYQGRLNTMNIKIEREYDPRMDLFCFAGEVRQVFANLVGNAIDASSDDGRLVIHARRSQSWKEEGTRGVRFTFADTGQGMEPEVRRRIFEAFFTTKLDTGTGLGLWVSQEIVVKHRGTVHVRSRTAQEGKGSGTVFQLFLPDDESLTATRPPAS